MKAQRYYRVYWYGPDCTALANVSFFARGDAEAKAKAERTGREIGLPRSRRQIYEDGRLVQDRPYVDATDRQLIERTT